MRSTDLEDRAADSLEFIRATMARSASFTVVPGWGGVGMGVVGLMAAAGASRAPDRRAWLTIWLLAAVAAGSVGLVTLHRKARRHHVAIWSASGRRFLQGFLPALVAGAILTAALVRMGAFDALPPAWLLLYGAGVLAGATSSVPVLTWLGIALMGLGGAASLVNGFGDLWLGAGFGALHVVFGSLVARRHGG
ncbi:MAG: hypothetical protein AB7O93_19630 [Vicinamibacterales bacterium]